MKTKFYITSEVFSGTRSLEQCFEYYEKYYKKEGFILDKKNQDVYKLFDKEININEGDRVLLYGTRIVEWKCLDFNNDIMEYSLIEE